MIEPQKSGVSENLAPLAGFSVVCGEKVCYHCHNNSVWNDCGRTALDKSQLLRKITSDEEERLVLARLLDQWERCQRRNIPASTPFLTPQQQRAAETLLQQSGGSAVFAGGYEEAERRIALFLPDYLTAQWYAEDEEYPLCAVRCTYRTEDHPTHRDFLGSLMGLGIRRDTVGDILVSEGSCDILLRREILPFVLQNYTAAGRVAVKTVQVSLSNLHLPERKCQEIRDTVAALRLDSLVSSGFRISRSKAADLIRAGKVEVNWCVCQKADRLCSEGDQFSARGFGKCCLRQVGGLSKKGRITVLMERYQ